VYIKKPGHVIAIVFLLSFFLLEQCVNQENGTKENQKEKEIIANYPSAQVKIETQIPKTNPENINKIKEIPAPEGFFRISSPDQSFRNYLQNLPIKKSDNTIYLYNGQPSPEQSVHFAVLKMDIGDKDLQQCADAIIRLRAEYLFQQKDYQKIHFNYTSGDTAFYSAYAEGFRPVFARNKVKWVRKENSDYSYETFREYLENVFKFAGSFSLSKELQIIEKPSDIDIGDIFIQGGFPGHAVIVVDLAINKDTKEKVFLLAQSFMPAQELHILKNNSNYTISPWYKYENGEILETPVWTFTWNNLKRFE